MPLYTITFDEYDNVTKELKAVGSIRHVTANDESKAREKFTLLLWSDKGLEKGRESLITSVRVVDDIPF